VRGGTGTRSPMCFAGRASEAMDFPLGEARWFMSVQVLVELEAHKKTQNNSHTINVQNYW
jgi:hypothetical protein